MSNITDIKTKVVSVRHFVLKKEVEYIERGYADEAALCEQIGKKLDNILKSLDTVSYASDKKTIS